MSQLSTYLLLDAARMGESMYKAKELNSRFDCLYRGRSEETLEAVAPYLFSFDGNTSFSNWLYEEGWGNAWGVVVSSKAGFEECWKHFRKFLLVKTEDGQELYFRFYDPRVLSIFLPTCDEQQVKELFGCVEKFIVESEDKAIAIEFTHTNGLLHQAHIDSATIFGEVARHQSPIPGIPNHANTNYVIIEEDDIKGSE
ncbi:MAG: DUF4123 domain-containing protein [Chitinophagaceae bacterium]|nr:DUF4123 domain-containing protein [Chitinophagaceae bacterium]